MKKFIIGASLFLFSTMLFANVSIESSSYKKEKVKDKVVWVKAKKVLPGTIIKYVNTITNSDDIDAENLIIKNNIPKNMIYVNNSTKCGENCSFSFSVDNGKTFDKPKNLFIIKNGKKVKAKPSDYNSIQWTISILKSNNKTKVEYKAKLK